MTEETQNQSEQNIVPDAPGNESFSDAPDYRESFPPELKTSMEKFATPQSLAEGYFALEKDASRLRNERDAKGIIPPGENATPEEISAFHKALGTPDTPEGYELVKPELPEGMIYDEERTAAFAALAHSKGVSKEAFQALHDAWNEYAKDEFEKQTAEAQKFLDESTATMKKEWGKDFDSNLAQADKAIDRIFGEDFNKMLKDTGLANHPDVIRGMYKASQAIGEHSFSVGKGTPSGETYTMEKLISMKMDPRYSDPGQRDPAFIKEVEAYNKSYAESLGAQG